MNQSALPSALRRHQSWRVALSLAVFRRAFDSVFFHSRWTWLGIKSSLLRRQKNQIFLLKSSTQLRYLGISLLLLLIASALFIFYKRNSDSVPAKKNESAAQLAPSLLSSLAVAQVATHKLPEPSAPAESGQQAEFNEALCHELASAMKKEKDWPAAKKKLELEQEKADLELQQMVSVASRSQEPRSQAAALFLNALLQADQVQKKFSQRHPECKDDQPCMDEANEAANSAEFTDINALAKLAVYSPDPQLYALAFHACKNLSENPQSFCHQISAQQWAQRDPENGSAWQYVLTQAEQASKGKQNNETETALFRLSQAKKFDLGLTLLSEFQKNPAMQSANALVRPALLQYSMGMHAALTLPGYQPVLAYCKSEMLGDANRRQTCESIANKLVADEGTFIGRAIGLKMGERLAWAPEKIASLREESDALHELARTSFDGMPANEASSSAAQALQACLWTVENTHQIENLMLHGEVQNFRSRLAKQKRSRAELAASYRQYKNQMKLKAETEKSLKQ